MSKAVLAALLLAPTFALTQSPASSVASPPPALTDLDLRQIHAALSAMDDAWNRHDMRAMTSYMTDDVQWVNVVGMIWRGQDEVFRAHEAFHKTIFKDRQVHPPESNDL